MDAEFSYPFPVDECSFIIRPCLLHLHSRGGGGHQDWWQAGGLHPNRSSPPAPIDQSGPSNYRSLGLSSSFIGPGQPPSRPPIGGRA